MPHTVYLAVMKLLEALGAIDYVDESASTYQEDINPVDKDKEAICKDGCEEEEDMSNTIISIAKVSK
ncbi:uncharacterized protein FOMMEDRAFT_153989 [Fomitiporia mediterranea MF3/22]|uniref:uncharacterized protein n=1 Tax=Fomitiporia mediterranea (strain MF3/22) TaxID=694068 RepID=UPI0004409012|nr:uncharacterized protein FOMMEDRAFT_153989 [Fomitiporia mediterranea MF3/22]EJD04858.1 hypothetical protein FOMMEDRAFT_153989 [Fomitiporia mediterranea MF3/22]